MAIRIATCPWSAPLEELCEETARAGYEGIQYGVSKYAGHEQELGEVLARHGLQLAATTAGGMFQDPNTFNAEIERAVAAARSAKILGAEALEMMCGARPVEGPTGEQIRAYAEGLNELGRRCADLGVRVGVHNHCIQFLETEGEIDRLYQRLDPSLVGTGFDTGHLALAGMDAAAVCRRYLDHTAYVHLKDLYQVSKPAGEEERVMGFEEALALAESADIYAWLVLDTTDAQRLVLGGGKLGHRYLRQHRGLIAGVRCCDVTEYQFAEIGHGGLVDFRAIVGDLQASGYDGWLAVELDVSYRTPFESARLSRQHLRDELGV